MLEEGRALPRLFGRRRLHPRLRALLLLHRRKPSCLHEAHDITSRVTVSMLLCQRGLRLRLSLPFSYIAITTPSRLLLQWDSLGSNIYADCMRTTSIVMLINSFRISSEYHVGIISFIFFDTRWRYNRGELQHALPCYKIVFGIQVIRIIGPNGDCRKNNFPRESQ